MYRIVFTVYQTSVLYKEYVQIWILLKWITYQISFQFFESIVIPVYQHNLISDITSLPDPNFTEKNIVKLPVTIENCE